MAPLGGMTFVLLPIYPEYKWYGLRSIIGISVGKGENGWIWCGGNGDGSRVVDVGDDEAGVEGCV